MMAANWNSATSFSKTAEAPIQNFNVSLLPSTVKLALPNISSSAPIATGKVLTSNCMPKSDVKTSSSNTPNDLNASFKISSVVSLKQSDIVDICFKGENLQQLSTNALPPYAPAAPPAFMQNDMAAEVHCCSDCGDTFAMKASLTFHLERRSILIKFPCDSCTSTQIFYNRCSLLSHVRSHGDKGEVSDMGKAIINPLPRIFMDGIHTDFVNNLEDEFNSVDDPDVTSPTKLLEFSIKELDVDESSENIEENKVEKENEISVIKVKCYDCDQEFESVKDRKEHLTNGDKIPVAVSPCSKCGILCPSKCSLKAHQRIHLQVSPYICPECGDSPDSYWEQFQAHLKYKCFHFSRAVGYKCPVCKRLVRTNEALSKHMELHTERYAKCDTCPRAFKSPAAFNAHKKINHIGEIVLYNIIYKCALCDIVFLSNDQMLSHRAVHLKDQVCEYIFNCMQCGKALDTKLTLLEHLKSCHQKTYKHNVCDDSKIFKSNASPLKGVYKGRVECILCHCTFLSHQGYGVHIARSHVNSKFPCNFCYIIMPNRKEMIVHGKKHLKKGGILCLLCHNKQFEDNSSLDSHLLNHVERLKFCSFCPICDQPMQSLTEAMNHLRTEHYLKSSNDQVNKPVENKIETSVQKELPSLSCHFCRKSFDDDINLQSHLAKEHNVNNRGKRTDSTVVEEPVAKRPRTDESTCGKCNFKTANRTDFKKHILEHKINKSTFQCQECGLCFVVAPSLTKHLKIVHKIRDAQKYIAEEGTNFTPDVENPTDTSNRNALECSVCFIAFPTESSLKTHMRSHGMAFIQAKKSSTC